MSELFQLEETKCRVTSFQKKLQRFPNDPDTIRNLEQAQADQEALERHIFPERFAAPVNVEAVILEEEKVPETVAEEVTGKDDSDSKVIPKPSKKVK